MMFALLSPLKFSCFERASFTHGSCGWTARAAAIEQRFVGTNRCSEIAGQLLLDVEERAVRVHTSDGRHGTLVVRDSLRRVDAFVRRGW